MQSSLFECDAILQPARLAAVSRLRKKEAVIRRSRLPIANALFVVWKRASRILLVIFSFVLVGLLVTTSVQAEDRERGSTLHAIADIVKDDEGREGYGSWAGYDDSGYGDWVNYPKRRWSDNFRYGESGPTGIIGPPPNGIDLGGFVGGEDLGGLDDYSYYGYGREIAGASSNSREFWLLVVAACLGLVGWLGLPVWRLSWRYAYSTWEGERAFLADDRVNGASNSRMMAETGKAIARCIWVGSSAAVTDLTEKFKTRPPHT